MGLKFLWDTNTAIYFLQKLFPPNATQYIYEMSMSSQVSISCMTEIELQCWNKATPEQLFSIKTFISGVTIIELEPAIKAETIRIRRLKRIKLPDAIIAATAIVYNMPLVTRNAKDFLEVAGLQVINPWTM